MGFGDEEDEVAGGGGKMACRPPLAVKARVAGETWQLDALAGGLPGPSKYGSQEKAVSGKAAFSAVTGKNVFWGFADT